MKSTSKELLLHEALEDAGIEVVSVSADGRVELAPTATKEQEALAQEVVRNFQLPSRGEALAYIQKNREALIDKLLLDTFYPLLREESASLTTEETKP